MNKKLVEVEAVEVNIDLTTKSPVLDLVEIDGERELTISIGILEAASIATALEDVTSPRPMTHDLMFQLVDAMQASAERIEIVREEQGIFFANLVLKIGEETRTVDCRPSDGVALALRAGAPILVSDDLLGKSENETTTTEDSTDENFWDDVLKEMDDDDFGKYKM